MERRDIPLALLTLVFCAVIFFAGRWSATSPVQTTTVIREVAAVPSVIIVPSAAQPAPTPAPIPLAVLPEVEKRVQVPVRAPKSVATAPISTAQAPKAVPSVPIVLEETPELPQNPYAR